MSQAITQDDLFKILRGYETQMARLASGLIVEPWHVVGAANQPAFENGWVNYGSGFATLRYRKDLSGFVHIKGIVKNGVVGNNIFTLPAGYRPAETEDFVQGCNGAYGQIRVTVTGLVYQSVGASNASQWVNGIRFYAEL